MHHWGRWNCGVLWEPTWEQQNQQSHFLGRMNDRASQAAPKQWHLDQATGTSQDFGQRWEVLGALRGPGQGMLGTSQLSLGTEVSSESRSSTCHSLYYSSVWCWWRQCSSCVWRRNLPRHLGGDEVYKWAWPTSWTVSPWKILCCWTSPKRCCRLRCTSSSRNFFQIIFAFSHCWDFFSLLSSHGKNHLGSHSPLPLATTLGSWFSPKPPHACFAVEVCRCGMDEYLGTDLSLF